MTGPKWAAVVTADSEQQATEIADEILDTVGYTGAPLELAGGWAVAVPLLGEQSARDAAVQITGFTGRECNALTVDVDLFAEAAQRRTEQVGGFEVIIRRSVIAAAKRQQRD